MVVQATSHGFKMLKEFISIRGIVVVAYEGSTRAWVRRGEN
jgi:hypothetical protein